MFTKLRPKPFIPVTKPVVSSLPNYSHLKSATEEEIPPPMDLSRPSATNDDQNKPANLIPGSMPNNNCVINISSSLPMDPKDTALNDSDDTNSALDYMSKDSVDIEEDHSSIIEDGQTSDIDSGEYHFIDSEVKFDIPHVSESIMVIPSDTLENPSLETLPAIPVIGINNTMDNTSDATADY